MYKFIGKQNHIYEIDQKLNSNCPASEKSGTGPGSCGGSKGGKSDKSENQTTTNDMPFSDSISSGIDSIMDVMSGSAANRVLSLPDDLFNQYVEGVAERTWKENVVSSNPPDSLGDDDKRGYMKDFKKAFVSELEGMHGKRSDHKKRV